MVKLHDHPSVRAHHAHTGGHAEQPRTFTIAELRSLARQCGADDVGFVEIERPEVASQRANIERALPGTRVLISYVVRMNRDAIRSPERATANLEFHHGGDEVNEVGHRIARILQDAGWRALNPAMGFPMEMSRFPGGSWTVSHKPVAVAAGLGQMGIHRNVIHPRFGNFILLGTVLTDVQLVESEASQLGRPIDWNPCLECKLCVAACPVGAIKPDGAFDFSGCYTHNYREFMSGFTDLLSDVARSKNGRELRERVGDADLVSWWQSLAFGPNYKAAYCMAVCPAGEDVIGPFLGDRKQFMAQVVRPLQEKVETVYVVPGSDAEKHALRRFPHKPVRRVSNGMRPVSIEGFLRGLPLSFQRDAAAEVELLRVHFVFTSADEQADKQSIVATVEIERGKLRVHRELVGEPTVRVECDAKAWLGLLSGERKMLALLLSRKLKVKGPPEAMRRFQSLFARSALR